jgi:2-methylcitrate dehydratase PrpD
MAHAEDFDDMNLSILGHPSPPMFPAALAMAELCSSSGRQLVEAYIAGFEVETRVGLAINPGHYNRGWHATATLGVLGAAAASAKIFGLNGEQTRMALGIAASQSSGIRQNFGTMTKPFHAGNAARGGVLAAMLAKLGFTADLNILETPLGFCTVFRGDVSPEQINMEIIVAGLGEEYELTRSKIAFKPYPSCGETHTGIEIAIALAKEHNINPDDIERIDCTFNDIMNSVTLHRNPTTGLEGKFSIEYCVARALLDRKVTLHDFTDERVNQPEIRKLIPKLVRHVDTSVPMIGTILTIRLKDGREFTMRIDKSKGWPENPMSHAVLTDKYRDCAQLILPPEDIAHSIELLDNLEKVQNVKELTDLIVKSKPAQS